MKTGRFDTAPHWAESSAPRSLLKRDMPSLLLINAPEMGGYVVATIEESDAIANPGSYIGRLLRQHCALLGLPYVSSN